MRNVWGKCGNGVLEGILCVVIVTEIGNNNNSIKIYILNAFTTYSLDPKLRAQYRLNRNWSFLVSSPRRMTCAVNHCWRQEVRMSLQWYDEVDH